LKARERDRAAKAEQQERTQAEMFNALYLSAQASCLPSFRIGDI
jgi:hypothetical protein